MKILFVNACVNPHSVTLDLAKHLLSKLPGEITEINLERENIGPFTEKSFVMREKLLQEKDLENPFFKNAHQFAEADTVVIAAPFWNLGSPASVKAYFDEILVPGITFDYDNEDNLVGKVNVSKMIYVTTAGGPIFNDFGFSYVKTISNLFLDIEDSRCYHAENLDVVGAPKAEILQNAKAIIDKDF